MVEAIIENTSNDYFDSFKWYEKEVSSLEHALTQAIPNKRVVQELQGKLLELGLDSFEEKLGEGAFGVVIKVSGPGQKPLALKLEKYPVPIADDEAHLIGDARALNLPSGHHLGRALALLTYHEGEIHCIEEYDPKLHSHHLLVGVLMKAVNGIPFSERRIVFPLSVEAIKGYGKQLAESLHALHGAGYVHADLHGGNILAKYPKEGKDPYRIKLLDFGCARSATTEKVQQEWQHFAYLLASGGASNELNANPQFHDLLHNPTKGLHSGTNPYTGQEILNHPFFIAKLTTPSLEDFCCNGC